VVPNATASNHAVNLGQINAMFPEIADYTYLVTKAKGGTVAANATETLGSIYNVLNDSYLWAYTGTGVLSAVGDACVVEGMLELAYRTGGTPSFQISVLANSTLNVPVPALQGNNTHPYYIKLKLTFVKGTSSTVTVSCESSYSLGNIDGDSWNGARLYATTVNHTSGNSIPIALTFKQGGSSGSYVLGSVTTTVKKSKFLE